MSWPLLACDIPISSSIVIRLLLRILPSYALSKRMLSYSFELELSCALATELSDDRVQRMNCGYVAAASATVSHISVQCTSWTS